MRSKLNYGRLKCLIVDDDDMIQLLIATTMRALGVGEVITAGDGDEGLERVRKADNPFDLVICDWMMPRMDGFDFLKSFRNDHPATPFVMLTAKTSTKEFHSAKKSGADYFFMKPLHPGDLKARLGAVLASI